MRTVLYANQELAGYLRGNYILHWSSERPVPRITIDFGDGRTIERTITGNSAHYVLDAQGRVVDVLTGLSAPATFRSRLEEVRELAVGAAKLERHQVNEMMQEWHRSKVGAEIVDRVAELAKDTLALRERLPSMADSASGYRVTFAESSKLDRTSTAVIWRDMPKNPDIPQPNPIEMDQSAAIDVTALRTWVWQPERQIYSALGTSSEAYRATMFSTSKAFSGQAAMLSSFRASPELATRARRELRPTAVDATRISMGKMVVERPMLTQLSGARMQADQLAIATDRGTTALQDRIAAVQRNLAGDVAVGELVMRPVIHHWLAENPDISFEELNRRVFADLFLTPADDPWLGMSGDGNWTGIRNDGFRVAE